MILNFRNKIKIDIISPPPDYRRFLEEEFLFLESRKLLRNNEDARITFHDDLKMDPDNAVLVKTPVGYDRKGVFFYDRKHEIARIDFEDFSSTTSVYVSKRFNAHFLYKIIEYLLSLKIMKHGGVFCHASAVKYKGEVLLFPAWRHVGKTDLHLSFIKDGAELISDDGVILFKDGTIIPFTKRLHLLYFNFLSFPSLLEKTDNSFRSLMKFVENAKKEVYKLSDQSIDFFLKSVRVRFPITTINKNKRNIGQFSCDWIIHLNKEVGKPTVKHLLAPIKTEKLATKTTETTLFELGNFLSAYQMSALTQNTYSDLLNNASNQIFNTFQKSFSKAKGIYEATFNESLEHERMKDMIKEKINDR